jgi:hypothetical protein
LLQHGWEVPGTGAASATPRKGAGHRSRVELVVHGPPSAAPDRVAETGGGVPPTTVAEWAGHSVEVLLRIYATCLDGNDALVRRRVQAALGYADSVTDTDEVTVRTLPRPHDEVASRS